MLLAVVPKLFGCTCPRVHGVIAGTATEIPAIGEPWLMRVPCIRARPSQLLDTVDNVRVFLWRDDLHMRRKLYFDDLVFSTVNLAPVNSTTFLLRICASGGKVVLLVIHHDAGVNRVREYFSDAGACNAGQF